MFFDIVDSSIIFVDGAGFFLDLDAQLPDPSSAYFLPVLFMAEDDEVTEWPPVKALINPEPQGFCLNVDPASLSPLF